MVHRRTLPSLLFALLAPAGNPADAQDAPLPRLGTEGTRWVDERGNEVVLRGVNLGNWLLQEMWMHSIGVEGIPDQFTLEGVLADRFGAEAKESLMEAYRENFITARDFRIIRRFGMNIVRLPFVYSLLEDDASPFRIKPGGWKHIDRALDLSDAVWLLGHLFLGTRPELPCDGGTSARPGPGAKALADSSGDDAIDISDAVNVLGFLFLGSRPPVLGPECAPIAGCPELCGS